MVGTGAVRLAACGCLRLHYLGIANFYRGRFNMAAARYDRAPTAFYNLGCLAAFGIPRSKRCFVVECRTG